MTNVAGCWNGCRGCMQCNGGILKVSEIEQNLSNKLTRYEAALEGFFRHARSNSDNIMNTYTEAIDDLRTFLKYYKVQVEASTNQNDEG